MKFSTARQLCDAINSDLKKCNLHSRVVVKHIHSDYYLLIGHYGNEILPKELDDIKRVPVEDLVSEHGLSCYTKETPSTPSDAGKWIDKPLSPSNRRVDGPGASGYNRRIPELQDTVRRFAEDTSGKNSKHSEGKMNITKVANKLRCMANVERIADIDKLLREMSRLMSVSDKVGSRVSTLFDSFSTSYNPSVLTKLKNQLKKDGYKSRDNIVRLVDQIASLVKGAKVQQEKTGKDAERATLIEKTKENISNLAKVLPDVARNLDGFDLKDEAARIRAFHDDLHDINKAFSRLVNN